jgi:ribosome maturation factor RimP
MPNSASLIVRHVTGLIEPILDEMGYELVHVEYLSKHGRWVLRIFIDKETGVTINDCARVSEELGDLIDIQDIIDHEYVLEVSSPGLNRSLKKERDFVRAVGRKIKVGLMRPINGRRNFTGYLRQFQGQTLYLEIDGDRITLPWRDIDQAHLVYEFNESLLTNKGVE